MKKLLFIFFLLILNAATAQDVDLVNNAFQHENQSWFKLKAVLPVNNKLELSTQYIGRVYLDGESHLGHYTYLSGKYKIKKWITADLGTRFVIDQGYNLYRIEGGIKLKHDIGKFQFSIRTAAFRENKTHLYTRELYRAPTTFWRNRAEISWDPFKKLNISTSFETWTLHNNKHAFKLDKACYTAEVSYVINKHNKFSLAYQNQFDIRQKNKVSLNMYVLGYTHTFRKVKK